MSDAGGSVKRALPFGVRLVIWLVESGVGAGPGVKQSLCGAQKAFGALFFQAKIFRERKISKGVPAMRAALGRCVGGVEVEQASHAGFIAENGGRIDTAVGECRMRGQDCFGALQRSVPHRGPDERCRRIFDCGGCSCVSERRNVLRKLHPALEPVLASDYELSVGQSDFGISKLGPRKLLQARMMLPDSAGDFTITSLLFLDQLFCLLLVLLQARASGKFFSVHLRPSFRHCAWSPPESG